MARSGFPSDQQDQFMVRFPDGLRDRIKAAAKANTRSMNSEIIATLEERYPPLTLKDIKEQLEDLFDLINRTEPGYLPKGTGELLDKLMKLYVSKEAEGAVE